MLKKKKIQFKGLEENFIENFKSKKDYGENIERMSGCHPGVTEEDGAKMNQIFNEIKQDIIQKVEPMLKGAISEEAKECVNQMLEIKKTIAQLKDDIWKLANEDTTGKVKRELQVNYLIDSKNKEIKRNMEEYKILMLKAFDVVKADKVLDEVNDLVSEHKYAMLDEIDYNLMLLGAKHQILVGMKGYIQSIDNIMTDYMREHIGVFVSSVDLNFILQAVRKDESFADVILKEFQ